MTFCSPGKRLPAQLSLGSSGEPKRQAEYWADLEHFHNTMVVSKTLFSSIRCPVLVMAGERDMNAPLATVIAAYQMIPNSQLSIIPNTPHPAFAVNFDAVWNAMMQNDRPTNPCRQAISLSRSDGAPTQPASSPPEWQVARPHATVSHGYTDPMRRCRHRRTTSITTGHRAFWQCHQRACASAGSGHPVNRPTVGGSNTMIGPHNQLATVAFCSSI
jgi:hypothetical protein